MNLIPQQRKSGLGGLLLINGAVLFVLAIVTMAPFVSAQGGFRPRGNYHAVSGRAPGSESGVICVVDENNQQLIAFTYDPNTKRLVGIGGVDLARDIMRYAGGN